MRYLRGMIEISEQADLPMLRLAYRAGHLTMRQMYRSLHPFELTKNMWSSFGWRVRRLAQHKFLDSVKVDGLGVVLSLGRDGELFLQGKEPTIVERASRTGWTNRRDQVWHDIDLFEMQMALRSAGVVRLWQFETEVRADNDFTSFGYRKDYDAIVTFGVNGSSARVALEYERTGKSTREYERICAELNLETRVSVFLYLARSLQLQSFLLHGFRRTTRRLYVGIFQEFCGDPRQARLIDVRLGVTRRLDDCLKGAG
jgi:hypothetical protein